MAAAFVNLVSFSADPSAATLVFPAANHIAGNLLVVIARWASTATATVADTAGNVYTQAARRMDVADSLEVWYCLNCVGSPSNTITLTLSAGGGFRRGYALQYSGFGTGGYEPSLLRSGHVTSAASTTFISLPGIVSTAADQIIVAGYNVWDLQNWTSDVGWIERGDIGVLAVHDFVSSAAAGEIRTPLAATTGSPAADKQAIAAVFTGGVTLGAGPRAETFILLPV